MNFNTSEYDSTAGVVFEIERFSVNDGPGIRTLVPGAQTRNHTLFHRSFCTGKQDA